MPVSTRSSDELRSNMEATQLKGAVTLPSFCIILPMYNEESGASDCVLRIAEFLKDVPCTTAIIAVNDGSTDNTGTVLASLKKLVPGLIVETNKTNGGYGGANRTGFNAAIREGFEYALVMDADGTQDPAFIQQFFKPMIRSVDFIKATRYSPNSKVVGVSLQRRIVSWFGNRLAQFVLRLPLTDYTNGFRAIRVRLLQRLSTKERGFAMLIEEVSQAKKAGATFAEVPYTLSTRSDNGSKSKFVYSLHVYKSYLKYLFK